jgi:hypothetical protein
MSSPDVPRNLAVFVGVLLIIIVVLWTVGPVVALDPGGPWPIERFVAIGLVALILIFGAVLLGPDDFW